jgi:hypothetical protein
MKTSWKILQVICWVFAFIVNPVVVIVVGFVYFLLKEFVSIKDKKPSYISNNYYFPKKLVEEEPVKYEGYLN